MVSQVVNITDWLTYSKDDICPENHGLDHPKKKGFDCSPLFFLMVRSFESPVATSFGDPDLIPIP